MSTCLDAHLPRVWWIALVVVFMFALPSLAVALYAKRKGEMSIQACSQEVVRTYQCQPIMCFFSSACALLGAVFFCRGLTMPRLDAFMFIGSVGVVFVVLSLFSMARLLRSSVILCHDRVFILIGRRQQVVLFAEIRCVNLISGHIAIDTGAKTRTVIPLIFSKWRELYTVLAKNQGYPKGS